MGYAAEKEKRKEQRAEREILWKIGTVQIVIAGVAIVFNSVSLHKQMTGVYPGDAPHYISAGIWGGILFILCGVLAICVRQQGNETSISYSELQCIGLTHVISAFIAGVAALVLIGQTIAGIAADTDLLREVRHMQISDFNIDADDMTYLEKIYTSEESLAMNVPLLMCGLTEIAMCIWSIFVTAINACCDPTMFRSPGVAYRGVDREKS